MKHSGHAGAHSKDYSKVSEKMNYLKSYALTLFLPPVQQLIPYVEDDSSKLDERVGSQMHSASEERREVLEVNKESSEISLCSPLSSPLTFILITVPIFTHDSAPVLIFYIAYRTLNGWRAHNEQGFGISRCGSYHWSGAGFVGTDKQTHIQL
ncbi:mediator of RNA polymerase II transcription subunit 30 isoform X3 [Tachysurus ichikawai]